MSLSTKLFGKRQKIEHQIILCYAQISSFNFGHDGNVMSLVNYSKACDAKHARTNEDESCEAASTSQIICAKFFTKSLSSFCNALRDGVEGLFSYHPTFRQPPPLKIFRGSNSARSINKKLCISYFRAENTWLVLCLNFLGQNYLILRRQIT